MGDEKVIHVIVATGEWGQDQLRYRRHRLAEFLAEQQETKEVFWVCPAAEAPQEAFTKLHNGIIQFAVKDFLKKKMFRFARYRDVFYQKKLRLLLERLKTEVEAEKVCLWYTFPGFPLLSSLYDWDHIVYDCSDLWAAPISGKRNLASTFRQKVIFEAESRIIKAANTIFCTSEHLRQNVENRLGEEGKPVFTVENGVEYDFFALNHERAEVLSGRKGTVLGFIGGIKPKLDFKLVKKAARAKKDWIFLFVGPDGTNGDADFKEMLEEDNVVWTGPAAPAEVPAYMNVIDIGIMPYKPSPYNDAVFPLKLFEFLAAGKPVAGMNLPSTKKVEKEDVYRHMTGSDPGAFTALCEELERSYDDPSSIELRKKIACEKDWHRLFLTMLGKLNLNQDA
ncbi:glycosyltransferase [Bacillus sonorensis]|uniref:Teichuronic acid biosynthesis glycosyltransferase TuaH n=1 Tax=Bacillus sonorensis L12 TaxID=1274524 RepID=M5P1Q5_9BACI|nr:MULTISPECIES: glycosyltransferase [Bacillus]TWK80545.1 putative teichuronic acid biosynthesis glycosyltransferase TuaH [Bacillus paralicheniformis]EME73358.1 teichuronic acid biosynthesis glycosyltransferase TuaH [Bacillus sonorensis L12]MBG9914345.1 teichuronic acid biosynthesis glycosyltransferase tuaH [Bacillus sonorensis]MCY7857665.1 glycosyltransferase [Bacillus sonorensis]MCY8023575.1 glycosyltransferase [Bacillus sonorensis]